jgi:23S rRNA (adenine2503-C2)-methyltransferase
MGDLAPLRLLGLDAEELSAFTERIGEPAYRARQLFEGLYRQRISELEQISTLPSQLRRKLADEGVSVGVPSIQQRSNSVDGTVRYLVAYHDGQSVETVWMPDGDGGETGDGSEAGDESGGARGWSRATICVSSQVGCAVNCQFCLTALLGVKRNLGAGEIVGQVCALLNEHRVWPPQDRINLVFMGMGEPFLNYENFMKAARLLAEGVGIPASRMTVSTAGVAPRIYDFGRELVRPKLAISLNAPNPELRSRLMPLNRKWGLTELIAAAREFPLQPREKLTFEYVLLEGVNDAPEHARQTAELLRGIRAKVNLIALNPGPGIDFRTPTEERVQAFRRILLASGLPTFVRRPRGRDIFAACGQLKRTVELAPTSA